MVLSEMLEVIKNVCPTINKNKTPKFKKIQDKKSKNLSILKLLLSSFYFLINLQKK